MSRSHSYDIIFGLLLLGSPVAMSAETQQTSAPQSQSAEATPMALTKENLAKLISPTDTTELETALKQGLNPNECIKIPAKEALPYMSMGAATMRNKFYDASETFGELAMEGMDEFIQQMIGEEDTLNMPLLSLSFFANNPAATRLLIQYGADLNTGMSVGNAVISTPLFDAVTVAKLSGSNQAAIILLEAGADPNQKGIYGVTAIDQASMFNLPEMVSLLLKYGASVAANSEDGATPLHYASASGSAECVRVLLLHADAETIALKDADGNSALHCACIGGNTECVRLLLLSGHFNINEQDVEGLTPLHYAVAFEQADCVRLLLEQGADSTLKDNEGDTAVDYAQEAENDEIIRLLQDK